jgi:hypothetical protein
VRHPDGVTPCCCHVASVPALLGTGQQCRKRSGVETPSDVREPRSSLARPRGRADFPGPDDRRWLGWVRCNVPFPVVAWPQSGRAARRWWGPVTSLPCPSQERASGFSHPAWGTAWRDQGVTTPPRWPSGPAERDRLLCPRRRCSRSHDAARGSSPSRGFPATWPLVASLSSGGAG